MVKALYSDYAPADSIFFVGKVISNTDPLKLGRVQIRVMGVHTEIYQIYQLQIYLGHRY